MDKLIELAKVIWRNPKVTLPILLVVFPSLATNLYFATGFSKEPPKVAEKPLPAIRVIKDEPYNEIVIPTYKPHTHSLEEHSHPECKRLLAEHEASSLH